MGGVIIGTDPHNASVTVEVRDEREILRACQRPVPDGSGWLPAAAAVCAAVTRAGVGGQGAHGIGRPLTMRLVADGEAVLDVPAKVAAAAGRHALNQTAANVPRRRRCHHGGDGTRVHLHAA
jgi:transposase